MGGEGRGRDAPSPPRSSAGLQQAGPRWRARWPVAGLDSALPAAAAWSSWSWGSSGMTRWGQAAAAAAVALLAPRRPHRRRRLRRAPDRPGAGTTRALSPRKRRTSGPGPAPGRRRRPCCKWTRSGGPAGAGGGGSGSSGGERRRPRKEEEEEAAAKRTGPTRWRQREDEVAASGRKMRCPARISLRGTTRRPTGPRGRSTVVSPGPRGWRAACEVSVCLPGGAEPLQGRGGGTMTRDSTHLAGAQFCFQTVRVARAAPSAGHTRRAYSGVSPTVLQRGLLLGK